MFKLKNNKDNLMGKEDDIDSVLFSLHTEWPRSNLTGLYFIRMYLSRSLRPKQLERYCSYSILARASSPSFNVLL